MELTALIVPFLVGGAMGAVIMLFFLRGRVESQLATLNERLQHKKKEHERLELEIEQNKGTIAYMSEEKEALVQHYTAAKAGWRAEEKRRRELEEDLIGQRQTVRQAQDRITRLTSEIAVRQTQLDEERRSKVVQDEMVADTRKAFTDAFKALSADALQKNNQAFNEMAKQTMEQVYLRADASLVKREQVLGELVKPLNSSLEKVTDQIQKIEKERTSAYASLTEQVSAMARAQAQLQREAGNLVKALRQPTVRGRWGEMQLRKVVELAGMVDHCDFTEQMTVSSTNGALRPDLVVHLPNNKHVIVDAKAPLQAYLDALDADNEQLVSQKLMSMRVKSAPTSRLWGKKGTPITLISHLSLS